MENFNKKKVQIPRIGSISDGESVQDKMIDYSLPHIKDFVLQSKLDESGFSHMSPSIYKHYQNKKKKSKRSIQGTRYQSTFLSKNKLALRKVLQQQKVKSIVKNFMTKLNRNLIQSNPVHYEPYTKNSDDNFLDKEGFQIPNWFDLTFAFISIIQIFALCFVYTLSLVFDQFIDADLIETLQTFSMCFYTIQIAINFISIKTIQGRKITAFRDICLNYMRKKFFIDLLCLIILIVDINTRYQWTKLVRLCVVLKIKQCLQKMQKIQNVFINNFYKEQYWQLAKVFFVNFGFAHFLAVFLLAMAGLSQNDNWKIKIRIQNDPWYQQYAWAYYWGSTIMLTVGFGDLSASNYKQAICLTLIQTFSCILLAYNINCVGNLINNIRSQDLQKIKNFKTIRRLAEQNDIKDELQWKVCNFIDQSDKMKKKFVFEDDKKFISSLPNQLKGQFLKQSNIKIFESIGFFKNFSQKSLLSLAERIEVKIAHPEQIIFKHQDDPQLLILKDGKICYCTKLVGSDHSGTVIDVLKVSKKQTPKLIYLGFLTSNQGSSKFIIKSLKYSMIYFISLKQVIEVMKNSICDFQGYCQMKDKSKHITDQFQIIDCSNCSTKHSKMFCPKLHYCPIHQLVIYKHLQNVKRSRSQRKVFKRQRSRNQIISNCAYRLRIYFQKLQQSIFKKKNTKLKMSTFMAKKEFMMHESNRKIIQFALGKMNTNLSSKFDQQVMQNFEKRIVQSVRQIMNEKRISQGQQFFWDIECDIANNFKFYFKDQNPNELVNFVLKNSHRMQKSNIIPPKKYPQMIFSFISSKRQK